MSYNRHKRDISLILVLVHVTYHQEPYGRDWQWKCNDTQRMGNIPHVILMSKIRWGHGDGIDSENLVT